jgi:hypothetical protein
MRLANKATTRYGERKSPPRDSRSRAVDVIIVAYPNIENGLDECPAGKRRLDGLLDILESDQPADLIHGNRLASLTAVGSTNGNVPAPPSANAGGFDLELGPIACRETRSEDADDSTFYSTQRQLAVRDRVPPLG